MISATRFGDTLPFWQIFTTTFINILKIYSVFDLFGLYFTYVIGQICKWSS